MSTLITAGADTITPTIVTGVTEEQEGGNIVHPILGRSDPDVTLRPASLRTGEMTLGFEGPTSEADSASARQIIAAADLPMQLASTERPSLAMTFVLAESGLLTRELDDESRDAWSVRFEYQEVTE